MGAKIPAKSARCQENSLFFLKTNFRFGIAEIQISVESPFMAGFCGIYKGRKRANLRSLCHDDRICPILGLPDFKFGIAGRIFTWFTLLQTVEQIYIFGKPPRK